MLTWSGERRDKRQKKRSAGTEVTGTQRNNYKQADSFEKSLEIPHHHRSGSSFRGQRGWDRGPQRQDDMIDIWLWLASKLTHTCLY